jgi:hypothetical protein
MGGELLGDDPADVLIIRPLRGGHGKCRVAFPLQEVRHPERNLVQSGIDHIVTAVPVDDRSLLIAGGKEIHKVILQPHANCNPPGVPARTLPALCMDEIAGGCEVRNPEVIGTKREGQIPEFRVGFLSHSPCT